MNLLKILLPKNTFHCIACCSRFPKELTGVLGEGLCICKECSEAIEKYKSPSSFEGSKYVKFLLSAYPYNGALREAFIQYKFSGQRGYYLILSKLLIDYAKNFINKEDFDLIVPIPLSKRRLKERGFNQSELLAKELSDYFQISLSSNAVFRIRHTKRQSELNHAARTENVRGAFISDRSIVSGKRILLSDDIYTVGATMNECAHSLILAGAKSVAGITLFKSHLPNEYKEEYDFSKVKN